jgi:hypothetical protein
MRGRLLALILAALVFSLAVWGVFRATRTTSSVASAGAKVQATENLPRPHFPLAQAASPKTAPRASKPPRLPPAELDAPMRDLDKINLMLRDYRTLTGENPVGTNAEIMASLMGGNAKHATLGPPAGLELNDKGELIDQWGTPYFFHQLSRSHMEIRSAGPDKIMWTDDDPVIR